MLLQGSNPCRSAIICSHKSACVQKPPDFPGSAVARITMGRAHAVELAAHHRSAYRPSRLNCGRQTTLTARVPRADGLPLSNPLAGGGAAPGCRGCRDGLPAGDGVARGGGARPNRALSRSCVVWYITETIICVPEPLSPSFCRVKIPVTPQRQQGRSSADEDERRQSQHEVIIAIHVKIIPKY